MMSIIVVSVGGSGVVRRRRGFLWLMRLAFSLETDGNTDDGQGGTRWAIMQHTAIKKFPLA
jgi:hypothetical protein